MIPRSALHGSSTARPDEEARAGRRSGDEANVGVDGALGAARGVKRFLVVLALLGTIQVVVMLGVEAYRAVEGQRGIARLQEDIVELEAEAEALEAIVQHGDDAAYREQLARRRGFIYPGEVRVVPLR